MHAIIPAMILVTGGTGFIGRALIRHLVDNGYQVRTLIRPSAESPRLPKGVPVEVAVASFNDQRGLRAALVGVDTVYHLAGVERRGVHADLLENDIQGTQAVVNSAKDAECWSFLCGQSSWSGSSLGLSSTQSKSDC